jgi:hypothetical protein
MSRSCFVLMASMCSLCSQKKKAAEKAAERAAAGDTSVPADTVAADTGKKEEEKKLPVRHVRLRCVFLCWSRPPYAFRAALTSRSSVLVFLPRSHHRVV